MAGDAPSTPSASFDGAIEVSDHDLVRILTLRDYNTRVVVLGTALLGLAAGTVGVFMLLRKRALLGDALSHATLPGIGIAFIVMARSGGNGKWLPGLLLGAAISGAIGVAGVLLIRRWTRLKEDAALGVVLSVFFGLGVAILGVIQKMDTGNAAGLSSFIYGKTASMLAADTWLIAGAAGVVAVGCLLLFKEFGLLCFDLEFAGAQGWPTLLLDTLMLTLVILVTVIGLQAVGLILMIALLVIPPAAARFWTQRLSQMVLISAGIGAASGFVGSVVSATQPNLPAGAIIVLAASACFLISLTFGRARGVVFQFIERVRLERKTRCQHLLRAVFEWVEEGRGNGGVGATESKIPFSGLVRQRSWSRHRLDRIIVRAERDGLIERVGDTHVRLTSAGWDEARRVVRNHRLWELYLITHADIAPSHVDRDADELEHVLGQTMVRKLEGLLAEQAAATVPPSPHALA
ncbi:MAG: iron ABC transporter [Phycisphaerales bacterium]|nr:MAG: iron ABC transporter [Phycisphaerales bacterium]